MKSPDSEHDGFEGIRLEARRTRFSQTLFRHQTDNDEEEDTWIIAILCLDWQ